MRKTAGFSCAGWCLRTVSVGSKAVDEGQRREWYGFMIARKLISTVGAHEGRKRCQETGRESHARSYGEGSGGERISGIGSAGRRCVLGVERCGNGGHGVNSPTARLRSAHAHAKETRRGSGHFPGQLVRHVPDSGDGTAQSVLAAVEDKGESARMTEGFIIEGEGVAGDGEKSRRPPFHDRRAISACQPPGSLLEHRRTVRRRIGRGRASGQGM